MSAPDLERLLLARRGLLLGFVAKHGGLVLRYETAEDLVQGIHLRALRKAGGLVHRSDEETLSWLFTLARRFLADRRDHWKALRRGPGRLLRLTDDASATADPRAVSAPPRRATGPSTYASRREQHDLAVKALALLLPRDRALVRGHAEGLSVGEQAARHGISPAAAQRARLRALDRFRKAFTVLSRRR